MKSILSYLQDTYNRQDACGWTFIILYSFNVIVQLLKHFNVISPHSGFVVFLLGALAFAGFVLLFTLASNITSNIFAAGQLIIELYFSFVVPFLKVVGSNDVEEYVSIYIICMVFCLLSLMLWSMLMSRNSFRVDELRWIIILPMAYLLNIVGYWGSVSTSLGLHPLFEGWYVSAGTYALIKILLAPAMAIGYWKLSHSRWFSGNESDLAYPAIQPFNRFSVAFLIAVGVILILF